MDHWNSLPDKVVVDHWNSSPDKVVVDHWNSSPDKVVVDHWNSLPDKVVEASSVDSFKSSVNKHWRDYPLKFVPDFYGPEAGISGNSLEMDHRG